MPISHKPEELDVVEATLSEIDTSVDAVKTAVDTSNVTLGNVETAVNAMKTSVDNVETAVVNVDATVTGLATDVSSTATNTGNTVTAVNALGTSINDVETAVVANTAAVNVVNTSVGTNTSAVNNVNASVNTVNTSVTNVNSSVNTVNASVQDVETAVNNAAQTILDKLQTGLGNGINVDAWGTQKTVSDYSLFHAVFTFNVSNNIWIASKDGVRLAQTSDNTDISVGTDGSGIINSGATATESSALYSKRHPRYQPDRGHKYGVSTIIPTCDDNGAIHRFGLFDEDNGVYFEVEGTGSDCDVYACIKSNGIVKRRELINIPFTIDWTKGVVSNIQFQWRGVGNYMFWIGDPASSDAHSPNPANDSLKLVHVIDFLGTNTELTISNPALSVGIEAVNTIGNPAEIHIGCVDVTTEGGQNERMRHIAVSMEEITVTNPDTPMLAIRIPETWNGRRNTRDFQWLRSYKYADDRSTVISYITRDATSLTGTNFQPVSADSSLEMTSIDPSSPGFTAAFTFDDTNAERILVTRIEQRTTFKSEKPLNADAALWFSPGDIIVFTGNQASNPNADAQIGMTIEFGEEE